MLEVNLLPHREAKRIADLRESVIVLLLGSLLIMMIALMMDSRVGGQLERAEIRISQLEGNIAEFKPQQDQVAEFRAQKSDLEEKLGVIRKHLSCRVHAPGPLHETLPGRCSVRGRCW